MASDIPKVKQVMTAIPATIEVGTKIQDALQEMQSHSFRHLPVVDGEEVIGILSERDILTSLAVHKNLEASRDLEVQELCHFNVYHVDPDDQLDQVLDHMAEAHIGSAVVMQAGELLGIFTNTDACKFWAKELRGENINQL